jgi:hypothetical protein
MHVDASCTKGIPDVGNQERNMYDLRSHQDTSGDHPIQRWMISVG